MKQTTKSFVIAFLAMIMTCATAAAQKTMTQNTSVVINSRNMAVYDGKTITGTVPPTSYAGNHGNFISQGAIVVDGIELNLTIKDFTADYTELNTTAATKASGISLLNGATLHLTLQGTNTLIGGRGGAGIAVPDGCTLEITAASTGSLTARGGDEMGGGAGIGSIGDDMHRTQVQNMVFPQGCGTIIINGGTITAKGGTWYMGVALAENASGGAAGIGSSENSGCSTSGTWGSTTYLNNVTGSITINGGTVTASGGAAAAGIGGGTTGTVKAISINGGTVTATNGGEKAAAIGTGWNGFTSGSGTLTCPLIIIEKGTIQANGNIGFGKAVREINNVGESYVFIGSNANVTCTGTYTSTNIPEPTADSHIVIPDGVREFKVYDPAGNNSTYSVKSSNQSILRLTAPTGYRLQLEGSVLNLIGSFKVYDGAIIDDQVLARFNNTSGNCNAVSGGQSMILKATGSSTSIGQNRTTWNFDFTVRVFKAGETNTISIQTSDGGTVTSDKSSAECGETITLTVKPNTGKMINEVYYNDGSDHVITRSDNGKYCFTMPVCDVTVRARFSDIGQVTFEGSGTSTNPYFIKNLNDIKALANAVNNGNDFQGKYFRLTANINCGGGSSESTNYTPIGDSGHRFRGIFDGNGKTIHGVRVYRDGGTQADGYVGIFGKTGDGAYIHDLTVSNADFTGFDYVGGIVGCHMGGTIDRCIVTKDVYVEALNLYGAQFHGGIAGTAGSGTTVSNCVSSASVQKGFLAKGQLYYGGIVGANSGTVSGCLADKVKVSEISDSTYGNSYGAICGANRKTNSSTGITIGNYYHACWLGGLEDVTGIGVCGADVDGALPIYQVTLSEGITASDANYSNSLLPGKAYYVDGATVILGQDREGYTAFYVTKPAQTITDGTFIMPAADVEVSVTWQENILQLSDGSDNGNSIETAAASGKTYFVILQDRTLYKDGDWNTLVLPFDVTIKGSALDGDGVKAMVLDDGKSNFDGTTLTLNFVDAPATIPAGTPFIIKWKEGTDLTSPVFSSVSISKANNDVTFTGGTFKGTYARKEWNEETPSILFLGEKNQLNWPLKGAHLNAFRAFFELTDPNAKAREFVMNFEEGSEETTGIESMYNVQCTMNNSADAWYTIDGVKLKGKPSAKGVYINRGKKVVMK